MPIEKGIKYKINTPNVYKEYFIFKDKIACSFNNKNFKRNSLIKNQLNN